MELLTAFIGAVIGAVASFALSEWAKKKNEREKTLAALESEVRVNREIAQSILENEQDRDQGEAETHWREIIPFSENAWAAIITGAALSELDSDTIRSLPKTYASIRSANFLAEKLRSGRYEEREGDQYIKRVEEAKANLDKLHTVLFGERTDKTQ